MQQHVKEFRHLRVNVQQVLRDGQMSGAGNGQKLRHALHQAQQEGRKSVHIYILLSFRLHFVYFCRIIPICIRFKNTDTFVL